PLPPPRYTPFPYTTLFRSQGAISPDDTTDEVAARVVATRFRLRQGDVAGAESEVRHAVEVASATDALALHADALVLLAQVLTVAERPDEARAALEEARRLYGRKRHLVGERRTAEALATTFAAQPTIP